MAQIDLPQKAAIDIVSVHALRTEPCHDDASVGDGRGVGIGGLDVAFLEWFAFIRNSLPNNLAALFVERVDHPAMARAIFRSVPITVKTRPKRRLRITADCAGYEDAISPDYR